MNKTKTAVWRAGEGWAFDVKVRGGASDLLAGLSDDEFEEVTERVRFWWWDLAEMEAQELGFSGVSSSGRSGGWLVPELDGKPVGGWLEQEDGTVDVGFGYVSGPEYSREFSGAPALTERLRAKLDELGRVLAGLLADVPSMVADAVTELAAAREEEAAALLARRAELVASLVAAGADAGKVAELVGPLVR
jgi:hypothetical protein